MMSEKTKARNGMGYLLWNIFNTLQLNASEEFVLQQFLDRHWIIDWRLKDSSQDLREIFTSKIIRNL
jgi:hypothetical protein